MLKHYCQCVFGPAGTSTGFGGTEAGRAGAFGGGKSLFGQTSTNVGVGGKCK